MRKRAKAAWRAYLALVSGGAAGAGHDGVHRLQPRPRRGKPPRADEYRAGIGVFRGGTGAADPAAPALYQPHRGSVSTAWSSPSTPTCSAASTALMYEADVWQDVFPAGQRPRRHRVFARTGRWRGRRLGHDGRRGTVFARRLRPCRRRRRASSPLNTRCCSRKTPLPWAWATTDWRLRGFYVQPLKYEYGEFVAPEPLQHANYVYADRADYALTVTLPERYLLAGPGEIASVGQRRRHAHMDARGGQHPRTVPVASACAGGNTAPRRLPARACACWRTLAARKRRWIRRWKRWKRMKAGSAPWTWDVTIAQSDYALEALSLPGIHLGRRGRRFPTPWPCAGRWPDSSSATAPIPCPRRTPGSPIPSAPTPPASR